jgi:hypothetical protein
MKSVRDVKTPKIQRTFVGLTNVGRVAFVAFLAVALAGGCHKKQSAPLIQITGIEPTDPQVADNLVQLTAALRHATQHHHEIRDFEGFLAVSPDLVVPPPPSGQKYAIGQGWKIVLVEANAK